MEISKGRQGKRIDAIEKIEYSVIVDKVEERDHVTRSGEDR